jgi:hypothetical protein
MAFATKHYELATTDLTPFHANSPYHPCLSFNLTEWQDIMDYLDVQEHAMKYYKINFLIKAVIAFAQDK